VADNAAMPSENPTMRGRIVSVSFPISQTGDERDIEIRGIGLSPLVGDVIAWDSPEGKWSGIVDRVALEGDSQWTAWGKVRRA
jgi:hypothetical protein